MIKSNLRIAFFMSNEVEQGEIDFYRGLEHVLFYLYFSDIKEQE